jgi:hypothetical protein
MVVIECGAFLYLECIDWKVKRWPEAKVQRNGIGEAGGNVEAIRRDEGLKGASGGMPTETI